MGRSNVLPAFVVSFGEEDFFLNRDLEHFKSFSNYILVSLIGSDLSESEFISVCETRTLDGSQRVVILDRAEKLKAGKALKAYISKRETLDGLTPVVAIVRSDKLPAIWAEAAKKGRLREHKKLKSWETQNEVIPWIQGEGKRVGLELDTKISEVLFRRVGSDLQRLSNELQKLSLIVPKGGKVAAEHVNLVVSYSAAVDPYQVIEAASDLNVLKALNLLSRLYLAQGDEIAVPLAYGLMKQVEKLLVARSMIDKGLKDDDIADQIGMHRWRCKNFFLPQARKHEAGKLARMMVRLCGLDMEMKRSSQSKRTRLELAIVALAS